MRDSLCLRDKKDKECLHLRGTVYNSIQCRKSAQYLHYRYDTSRFYKGWRAITLSGTEKDKRKGVVS